MPKQHMSDKHFQELLKGVREMKAIQRGESQAARTTMLEKVTTRLTLKVVAGKRKVSRNQTSRARV